ncbi:nucleolus protein [Talaromyces proteolyticus]|uniref:25S rRNA adenine-N(1) methyltransferase n=1 Tax=Talaromyces proteolyticus TaxID=1131652 RepID=A0AAD4L2G2_9EURO|nr:nucleolus protein [Talaromyces proteolyticus]KAH8702630.1 nucleolus protein [Talaromyces proteolyticus]
MTAKKRRSKRPALLSHSRPRITKQAAIPSLSSKATRNIIRSHHQLLKAQEAALARKDLSLVEKIDKEIAANGGLESYQLASKTGQSLERGGDSSVVFLDWIRPTLKQLEKSSQRLKLLEVGALSTKNACSRNPFIDITRIDLNSQEPGILQQDFMKRPFPKDKHDYFHAISLSLVLNFVPNVVGRGEMLKRCSSFLTSDLPSITNFTPYLFLVLPAACVSNSRYFSRERLLDIMSSLGYIQLQEKITNKLIYQLWEYHADLYRMVTFRKEELNPGKTRNNFTVILNDNNAN